MIWFFQREQDRLHYEIRHQPDGLDYELVITHPDGTQDVEHFSDAGMLLERSCGLENSLTAEGWQPPTARRAMDRRAERRRQSS